MHADNAVCPDDCSSTAKAEDCASCIQSEFQKNIVTAGGGSCGMPLYLHPAQLC